MNVLIVGSGGREHALAFAYSKSKKVKKVFVAPGNDLINYHNKKVTTLPNIQVLDFAAIIDFCKKKLIDLVDVAQDDPLAAGLVDQLEGKGIPAFGPTQSAAEIEWNKAWARTFMQKYKLPIPRFQYFTSEEEAIKYVQALPEQLLFIKAAGLALGKGVLRAENRQEAIVAIKDIKKFGRASKYFLIEEGMVGEEFSLFAICDGKDYVVIGSAQDHKRIFDHDYGLNTGGMGCVSPISSINKKILIEIETKILQPFMKGMQQEDRPYSGILYLGGMLTAKGIKVVEFNARWGDPEAQVILPSITTDYVSLVQAVRKQTLHTLKIAIDKKIRVSVAGCSFGYPQNYKNVKGKEIFGLEQVAKIPGIRIFGAGLQRRDKRFFANGGRLFHLVADGKTISQARALAYQAMSMLYVEGNNLHFRTDIGWVEMARLYKR